MLQEYVDNIWFHLPVYLILITSTKNHKQSLIHSPSATSGVQAPLKTKLDIT